jgi:cytochrome c biogenesis protein CcdA
VFEIVKLIWDVVVLRDAARKGQLNWKVWVIGFGFAIVVYAIGLPAALLYDAHPEYEALFVTAVVVIALMFGGLMWWGVHTHLQRKQAASPDEQSAP